MGHRVSTLSWPWAVDIKPWLPKYYESHQDPRVLPVECKSEHFPPGLYWETNAMLRNSPLYTPAAISCSSLVARLQLLVGKTCRMVELGLAVGIHALAMTLLEARAPKPTCPALRIRPAVAREPSKRTKKWLVSSQPMTAPAQWHLLTAGASCSQATVNLLIWPAACRTIGAMLCANGTWYALFVVRPQPCQLPSHPLHANN